MACIFPEVQSIIDSIETALGGIRYHILDVTGLLIHTIIIGMMVLAKVMLGAIIRDLEFIRRTAMISTIIQHVLEFAHCLS